MTKSIIEQTKDSQWFECIFISDNTEFNPWSCRWKKNDKGYATVTETGKVVLWKECDFFNVYDSIDDAKKHATCIKKCQNQTQNMIEAWNSIV